MITIIIMSLMLYVSPTLHTDSERKDNITSIKQDFPQYEVMSVDCFGILPTETITYSVDEIVVYPSYEQAKVISMEITSPFNHVGHTS